MGKGAHGAYHPGKFKLPREIMRKKWEGDLNTFDIQQIHSWNVFMNTFYSFNKVNALHSWSQTEQDCFLPFRPNFRMLFRTITASAFSDHS